MRITKLALAVLVIAAYGVTPVSAQVVKPFEELEGARQDRIEQDKRLERDAAQQVQRDRENKARQEAAGRTPDAATVTGAQGAR